MNSIQFNGETGRFEYMGRYADFSQDILRQFPSSRENNTAICHRVSFSFMATALINALNYYLYNQSTEMAEFYVLGLILAVTGEHQELLAGYNVQEEAPDAACAIVLAYMELSDDTTEEYRNLLNLMHEVMIQEMDDIIKALALEAIINRILDKLNNEPYNLQLGNASWNSSLGDAFDPSESVELKSDGFIIGKKDSKVLTILMHATKPGGEDFTESALHIYTAQDDQSEEEFFVYQSCSEKNLKRVNIFSDCGIPILYDDFITENRERFC